MGIICLCNILDILCVQCKLETLLFVMRAKVASLSSKPTLVCEHAFPLTGLLARRPTLHNQNLGVPLSRSRSPKSVNPLTQ